jgi:hypothetical protein
MAPSLAISDLLESRIVSGIASRTSINVPSYDSRNVSSQSQREHSSNVFGSYLASTLTINSDVSLDARIGVMLALFFVSLLGELTSITLVAR